MSNKIKPVVEEHLKSDIPDFSAGDTVSIDVRVAEGGKERIQKFEGIVIGKKGSDVSATFTVRKISRNLSDCKSCRYITSLLAYDYSFKFLNPFFSSFRNTYIYRNCISRRKIRYIAFQMFFNYWFYLIRHHLLQIIIIFFPNIGAFQFSNFNTLFLFPAINQSMITR